MGIEGAFYSPLAAEVLTSGGEAGVSGGAW